MYLVLFLDKIIAQILLFFIALYRRMPRSAMCRFVPTCSEFAQEKLKEEGAAAMFKIAKRILRCNPFANRKVD